MEIEGKGLGAIAKTDISKGLKLTVEKNNNDEITGTLILRDRPLFIIPNEVHTDNPDTLNTFLKGFALLSSLDFFTFFYTYLTLPKIASESAKSLSESDERYFYNLCDSKKVFKIAEAGVAS